MQEIRCAIVEDEAISMTMISGLAERTGILKIAATFDNPSKAIPWLVANKIDLLFLDIEMPEMSGLDLLKVLPYKPEVIVISGNPQYAIDAFDLAVTDYLLKPVKDYGRFMNAVNKVLTRLSSSQDRPEESGDNLFVKVDSLLLKLDLDSILWVEAFGDYIRIQTTDKLHTVYSTLKRIEDKLPTKKFVRVHRSYIVNISRIDNIDPSNLEINKKLIPVSETYKADLLKKISIL